MRLWGSGGRTEGTLHLGGQSVGCGGLQTCLQQVEPGCPGGAVDKHPPANAGDMGSSPGVGRSHMPQSN